MATNVDIAIRAKNEASGAIKQVSADLGQLDDAAGSVGGGLGNLGGMLAGGLIAGGLTVMADKAIAAAGAVYDLAKSAQSFDTLKASFDELAATAGESGDAMLNSLRGASAGMIADQDLILSANRAMMLGVAQSSEQMVQLLQVATVRGRAMGMSATDAFNDLVTGLGRMSPLILDNLGIVTGGEKVFDDYAKSLGRTAASLSDAERKQALFNKVLAESQGMIGKGVAANPFAQLDAQMANLQIQAGQIALPIAAEFAKAGAAAADELSSIFTRVNMSGVDGFGQQAGYAIGAALVDGVTSALTGSSSAIGDAFYKMLTDWNPALAGIRIGNEVAQGTLKAIKDSGIDVPNLIGQALGDSSALSKPEDQMKRLFELEQQIRTNFDGIMEDTRRLTMLMETGNSDLMQPVFDVRSQKIEELKRVRAEYASLVSGMQNVPGPIMAVNDNLWTGITGWKDMTRAAKDAVSPTVAAAQAMAQAGAAGAEGATLTFDFASSLQYVSDTATAIPSALSAAGNAISTIQGLMIQAAQAGADSGQAMQGFADAAQFKQGQEALARTLSSLGIDDQTIAYTIQLNTADAIANARAFASEAEKAGQSTEKVVTEADRARAALILAGYATAGFASGLSQIQAQAGATAGIIYNLTGAISQLNAVTGVMRSNSDLLGGITGQLNGVTSGLIDNMGIDGALAKGQELKVQARDQIESLRAQGYTTAEIGVIMQANVQKTQEWATGLDKVEQATGGVGAATQQVNQEYEDLKSKVSSVLSGALSPDIGFDPASILPRADDINENARRLAAIANEGIANQPWLEEFKATAPQAWSDIMAQVAAGVDAKTAAAKIYQDFQQGLRPDLIDKDLVKQRVKAMIVGDQNMAALAEEIAQELATEMNIPLEQALAAAGGAMGVATGAAGEAAANANAGGTDMTSGGAQAGQTFVAGFLATADGTQLVAGIVGKLQTEMPKFLEAGKGAGTQWGSGFMTTVESGIANPLINLLVTLVTPGIMAQMAAGKSQTEPPQ